MVPAVGTRSTSPTSPSKPMDASSGRNLRPYAAATSSPPGQTSRSPLDVRATPITTRSVRVLAGLPLRSVYVVTRRHARPAPTVEPVPDGWGNFPRMSLTQSPLHDRHLAAGAKLAEFGGWEMPLEYPTGVLKEHAAVRRRGRHLRRQPPRQARGPRPGRSGVPQQLPDQRPRPDRSRPGAVHPGLRRGDRRRRRRPHRLLPQRRRPAAGAQRGQLRRGRAAAGRRVPQRRHRHRPPPVPCRARGPGPPVGRGAAGGRVPGRARLHVVPGGALRGPRGRGLPLRLHRRARLRADRRQRGGPGALGRAARRG